ncbi:GspH/FimT family pseudopilin [Xanthomonas maliensis]|uniref:GspH/FimT family pseudopilin n=1 Tax=Xanthomonas maliensis TaxID=1321368 RepID=UPI0003B7A92E|nr:GspH/FimT family pseudopilin [Xanthomonas maliensis]
MRLARARGFSLLEVLMVLVITALAGTLVLLTLPDRRPNVAAQADTLAGALAHARDEAVLSLRMVEVSVRADGYRFRRQHADRWQPMEPPFVDAQWADGIQAALPAGTQQQSVRFDPTGAATPQRVVLRDGARHVALQIDANGMVQVDAAAR